VCESKSIVHVQARVCLDQNTFICKVPERLVLIDQYHYSLPTLFSLYCVYFCMCALHVLIVDAN